MCNSAIRNADKGCAIHFCKVSALPFRAARSFGGREVPWIHVGRPRRHARDDSPRLAGLVAASLSALLGACLNLREDDDPTYSAVISSDLLRDSNY